jgi:predicted ATPase
MIESIEFTNFKALRNTSLPLSPFTLLLGPNGSGKTTVLQGLESTATFAAQHVSVPRNGALFPGMVWKSMRSITAEQRAEVAITFNLELQNRKNIAVFKWAVNAQQPSIQQNYSDGNPTEQADTLAALQLLGRMRVFALDFTAIAQPVTVNSGPMQPNGGGLAAVLDDLKDNHPDRWESLLAEMCQWLPEYDYILFDKPQQGQKGIVLRTKTGHHRIPATELSQGTLIALALLTIAYLPDPPTVVGLEEIDRGLHPRLLRHLQDALYRLSYPESCGEKRPAIQVIATTHSPYLLDLYREHPEEVVLAEKQGLEVQFKRLTDIEHYQEIIGESPLSEVWYSGVLGGVSVKP